ncbi:MAG: hypothetical protein E6Q41_01280 [Cyclobacteriaceae bacterium]|nr:MAG: hypothetical protein E6Q41_01280 [Cyclobacteriaceae bacterium]
MSRKFIYLFLALLLPGLIFVFLRKFGKNEFNIPVYYEAGVTDAPAPCGTYPAPYRVADSVLQVIRTANKPMLVVTDTSSEVKRNLDRLKSELSNSFSIVFPESDKRWATWLDCAFILHKPWTAVLIDEQGQIRGYYSPASREEADRMLVEIRILLKQY